MSVQFGRLSFCGAPISTEYLTSVDRILTPYGPDGASCHSADGLEIRYYAFHTTEDSRRQLQPHCGVSGVIVTWDGRLDNRSEMVASLGGSTPLDAPDVEIVTAAYERWGIGCLARLIGDWALSAWDPKEASLILARDPIGTRHLYYLLEREQVSWSTILDPLVLLSPNPFELDEEYVAGWLTLFPEVRHTPYSEIRSVPPSWCVLIQNSRLREHNYWNFNAKNRIRYRSDADYEQHFRVLFTQSVKRRLRSDSPILAELSGGMDSSSIVSVADTILADSGGGTPRVDTVSYYDDTEPNWNERPYFESVERNRGRTGWHINVAVRDSAPPEFESGCFAVTPALASKPAGAAQSLALCMKTQGNRVILSGIGGDEVTGGVPTPFPELEDLLANLDFRLLTIRVKQWALYKREPCYQLLFRAARKFFPPRWSGITRGPAPWLLPAFVERNRIALSGYKRPIDFWGELPSFQENLFALDAVRRQLNCFSPGLSPLCEKRYPYLDRDLLEFLFAVPPDQLVRPGQRRSLMRRALSDCVPASILERRRKAYVARGPRLAISRMDRELNDSGGPMAAEEFQIADTRKFREAIRSSSDGGNVPFVLLVRTIGLERWLRTLLARQAGGTQVIRRGPC